MGMFGVRLQFLRKKKDAMKEGSSSQNNKNYPKIFELVKKYQIYLSLCLCVFHSKSVYALVIGKECHRLQPLAFLYNDVSFVVVYI